MTSHKPLLLLLLLLGTVAACRTDEPARPSPAPAPTIPSPAPTPDPAALQATLESELPPVPTPNERGAVLRILEAVTVLPLEGGDGVADRWLAFTSGLRGIDPTRYHALEVYGFVNGGWVLEARYELDLLDALPADGVRATVDADTVWIEVRGRGGLLSKCFTLLRLEGTTFTKEIEQCFREL